MRNRKTLLWWVWLLLLGVPFGAVAEPMVCRACGHPDYPPFMWHSGDRVVGVGPQVLAEILQPQGVLLESLYVGNWKRCLAELERGTVDWVVSAYRTEQRERYLEYVPIPLSPDYTSVFVWKDRAFSFRRWEDLAGKRMSSMLGDSHGQEFDAFAAANVTDLEVNKVDQALRLLELGRVDFLPGGLLAWQIRIELYGYGDKIVPLATPLKTQGLYFAVSKASRCRRYLPSIQPELQRMQSEGRIDALLEQYRARYINDWQTNAEATH